MEVPRDCGASVLKFLNAQNTSVVKQVRKSLLQGRAQLHCLICSKGEKLPFSLDRQGRLPTKEAKTISTNTYKHPLQFPSAS
jgi:hypothetical protein